MVKQYAQMACRYIMAGLLGWTMLDDLMHHGEPREGKRDGGATFFGVMIIIMILAGGGFWG